MSFIWPIMLISLLLVPLCVGLYLRLQQRRRRLATNYGAFGLMQEATGRRLGLRRHLPPALFLAGLTILLVSAARPQAVVSLPRQEGIVIMVFDVSGSMAADDVEPNRLEVAKVVGLEFVERQPSSVQIGLVAFSDGGIAVQAPTNDQEAIVAAIGRLAPQRGTSVGQGILVALNTIAVSAGQEPLLDSNMTPVPGTTPAPLPEESYPSAAILLLSDGENNEDPDPLEAAQTAADYGVRIYTIGVGTTAGTALEADGFTVHTRLEEAALQQIAQLSEGIYFSAEKQEDLEAIYENLEPQFVIRADEMEVTSLFAGAGIFVFLIGGAFSLLWFGRVP
jgi:Ca-activated chloride channel family protein